MTARRDIRRLLALAALALATALLVANRRGDGRLDAAADVIAVCGACHDGSVMVLPRAE